MSFCRRDPSYRGRPAALICIQDQPFHDRSLFGSPSLHAASPRPGQRVTASA